MGQAEQVGGKGGQHRRQSRIAEGETGVGCNHPPALRKGEARRQPRRQGEQQQVGGAAADFVAEQGHQQPARGAAHAAQHHRPHRLALFQPPLHPQPEDDGAEQQHRRGGKANRCGAQPVLPGPEHLAGGVVGALLPGGSLLGLGRVAQQGRPRQAHRQGRAPQGPEGPPDPPQGGQQPHHHRQKGPRQPGGGPDDAGGKALFPLVPLLDAGLDGRVQKGGAQPRRDAEAPGQGPAPVPRQQGRPQNQPPFQQGGAPEGGAAGAVLVLQKAPDDAPHPIGRNQNAEGQGGGPLLQGVFLHHRLLEHTPGGGQAGEQLDAGPGGQDGGGTDGFLAGHGQTLPSFWR